MLQQFLEIAVPPSQFLLVGNEMMDGLVALLAHVNAASHLLAGEPLLEPLVAVQRAGEEVVEVLRGLRLAELAKHGGGSDAGVRWPAPAQDRSIAFVADCPVVAASSATGVASYNLCH
jgi:hypothetical protein